MPRLIDADALMRDMGVADAVKYGNKTAEQQHNSYSTLMKYEIADYIEDAPAIEAIPIDTVAEILAELFGEECCCNYNGIDEWLPMLCEHSETCPEAIGKNGCWKQFIKHWNKRIRTNCGAKMDLEG